MYPGHDVPDNLSGPLLSEASQELLTSVSLRLRSPAGRPRSDASTTLERLQSILIFEAGLAVIVQLPKSPDTIRSLTVANIRSGRVRFRSRSLRNSLDSTHTLPKSPDIALST